MHKKQSQVDLAAFIDNETTVEPGMPLKEARSVLASQRKKFAAVVSKGKIYGIIREEDISEVTSKTLATSPRVKSRLISEPVIASIDESTEAVINRALSRSDKHILDDIILVDADGQYLGLISAASLLRIQKKYYTKQTDELLSLLNKKIKAVEDSENDLKLAASQLKENRLMVKRMTEMRSEFVAKFGYEARTPMTSIIGMMNLLADSKLAKDQKRMVFSANASAQSLLRLIDSVIDFSRIELDSLELKEGPFCPVEMIEKCIAATKEEAEEKDLIIQFDHEPLASSVVGDAKLYSRVVESLIGKAIDLTNSGGIRVILSERRSGGQVVVRTEIRDSGMGMGNFDTQGLFLTYEPNSRKDKDQELVALVSRRIANKMGGTIHIKNDGSLGNQFVFDVPFGMAAAALDTSPPTSTLGKTTPLPKPKVSENLIQVLIVDDNRINLEVARRFLVKQNCNVFLALSGREAIEKLKKHQIDGIFMDCQMPGLSGYETAELIRSGECGEENSGVFIAAMTAHVLDQSRKLCDAVGMNYFIPKPVRKNSFETALTELRKYTGKNIVSFDAESVI